MAATSTKFEVFVRPVGDEEGLGGAVVLPVEVELLHVLVRVADPYEGAHLGALGGGVPGASDTVVHQEFQIHHILRYIRHIKSISGTPVAPGKPGKPGTSDTEVGSWLAGTWSVSPALCSSSLFFLHPSPYR